MNDELKQQNTMKPKFLTSNTCRVKKAFFLTFGVGDGGLVSTGLARLASMQRGPLRRGSLARLADALLRALRSKP